MVKQALVLSDTAGPRGLASVRVRRPRRRAEVRSILRADIPREVWWGGDPSPLIGVARWPGGRAPYGHTYHGHISHPSGRGCFILRPQLVTFYPSRIGALEQIEFGCKSSVNNLEEENTAGNHATSMRLESPNLI